MFTLFVQLPWGLHGDLTSTQRYSETPPGAVSLCHPIDMVEAAVRPQELLLKAHTSFCSHPEGGI